MYSHFFFFPTPRREQVLDEHEKLGNGALPMFEENICII